MNCVPDDGMAVWSAYSDLRGRYVYEHNLVRPISGESWHLTHDNRLGHIESTVGSALFVANRDVPVGYDFYLDDMVFK